MWTQGSSNGDTIDGGWTRWVSRINHMGTRVRQRIPVEQGDRPMRVEDNSVAFYDLVWAE